MNVLNVSNREETNAVSINDRLRLRRLLCLCRNNMRFILFAFSIIVIILWVSRTNTNAELINSENLDAKARSFRIDYENDQFLKDGQPFRFIAGSFHYFRALPQTWQRKLRTLRASGLNAVTTYVEWALHNPKDGVYHWSGMGDLERFIQLAVEEDLLVILRPGPYICAERDMGGFPYWLLTKYPNILLRTSDLDYLQEVRNWYSRLMPKMERYLYGNGGPIILVQVENEYGSFACDRKYSKWLRDETAKYVGDKAVLFTNDGPSQLPCGKIENVLAALDFGAAQTADIDKNWKILRGYEPKGPLVNAEYYPGWLTHWQEPLARVDTEPVIESLKYMLNANASVNFYMFYGGTNFGFTAGANNGGPGSYQADVTSYDYDAPMDEGGDPTPKYMMIRDILKDYLPLPNIPVPKRETKMKLPAVQLVAKTTLLSDATRRSLGRTPIYSTHPMTFEQIDQYSGFVLYETHLPKFKLDPSVLTIPRLHDRAMIYVDDIYLGTLSRENLVNSIPLSAGFGNVLQIFVENQGRINYGIANDFKGIIGDVLLNNATLLNWTITGYPLEDSAQIENLVSDTNESERITKRSLTNFEHIRTGPTLFHGTFDIDLELEEIFDTYIDPSEWGKGIIFINGYNLGRYWPLVGPQITLYLPKELLRRESNSIAMIELQRAPDNGLLKFDDRPNLNSTD